jgi:hypothetical protein
MWSNASGIRKTSASLKSPEPGYFQGWKVHRLPSTRPSRRGPASLDHAGPWKDVDSKNVQRAASAAIICDPSLTGSAAQNFSALFALTGILRPARADFRTFPVRRWAFNFSPRRWSGEDQKGCVQGKSGALADVETDEKPPGRAGEDYRALCLASSSGSLHLSPASWYLSDSKAAIRFFLPK